MNNTERIELIAILENEVDRYEQKINDGFTQYSRLRDYTENRINELNRKIINNRNSTIDSI